MDKGTVFAEITQRAYELSRAAVNRNSMYDEMERMYLMVWPDEDRVKSLMNNVKITRSPDARNALVGAIRLLTATDPQWKVERDQNMVQVEQIADKLERAAAQMWQQAGRVAGQPRHYDVVLSALLFSDIQIGITRTDDMVKYVKESGKTGAIKRAEAIAEKTPYLFDVWDPRTGYPEFDDYGMAAYYREVETTVGRVADMFGLSANKDRNGVCTLCHWFDYDQRITWVQGEKESIIHEDNKLGFIPVVVHLVEGSRMLQEYPEYQQQPFLYTLWKSGLWERQSLALTVLYTMTFAMGANPMYLYQANQPGKELSVDWSKAGGVASIDQNENFGPLIKAVIDPSIMQGLDIAERKLEASTIFGQTLGEPLGGNSPFALVSLLHQAGRLPLVTAQRKASWAIADAVRMAMRWAKEEPWEGSYSGYLGELASTDIPERFELECVLDIDLPQDKLQAMNTAAMAVNAGLTSKAFARQNFLNIGQSSDMDRDIWSERAADIFANKYFMQMEAVIQQAMQPQQPPQAPPGQAPGQPPMQAPAPGPQPGMEPQLQGLPPEMAQGSGQPPIQPPGMPPMNGGM